MRKFAALLAAALAMVMAPIALAGNGSFETGDFTDWSVDAPSGDATVLPGGHPAAARTTEPSRREARTRGSRSRRTSRSRPVTR